MLTISRGRTSPVPSGSPSDGWIVLSSGTLDVLYGSIMSRAIDAAHRAVAILLFAGQLISPSWAQEREAPAPGLPLGSEITFEWSYSCPSGRRCSFSCPGQGGASHVTKLTIYVGTIPVGSLRDTPAMFYNFSTREIPQADGFVVSAGLSTLACQINGMALDYSGPVRSPTPQGPKAK